MDLTCMSFYFPPEAETTRSGTENLIYSPKLDKRTRIFLFFYEGKTNDGVSSRERRRLHGNEQEKKPPLRNQEVIT